MFINQGEDYFRLHPEQNNKPRHNCRLGQLFSPANKASALKTVKKTGGQAASREAFSPQTILRANFFITARRFQINQQHFHSFNEKGLGKCYLQTA
ncbi:MAG: hypothetical protein QMB52_02590 [Propionivibrio sp.]